MRTILFSVATLLCLAFFSPEATAFQPTQTDPTGTISGTVTDANSGKALPGVNVTIDSLQLGTATDKQGRFRLPNVPVGRYTVTAQFVASFWPPTATSTWASPVMRSSSG